MQALRQTSELIIDEFEKLASIRKRAREAIADASKAQQLLLKKSRPDDLRDLDAFMHALSAVRNQRGHLISLREVREVDRRVLDALEAGRRPPEFEEWMERMGIWRNGRLTDRAGDPSIFDAQGLP